MITLLGLLIVLLSASSSCWALPKFFPLGLSHETQQLFVKQLAQLEGAFKGAKESFDNADKDFDKVVKEFKHMSKSIDVLAGHIEPEKISKALTQGGIVLTSTATAILSVYAVFLIVQYELSRQPDTQEHRKAISWKTLLAGTVGTTLFVGSVAALIKSSAIAHYSIHG